MLNMGGPADLSAVRPFLSNLFKDADLIQSNSFLLRNLMSRLIVNARSHRVTEQYKAIGGGSPILSWTDFQGRKMTELLNSKLGHKYFFKHYVAFRYAHPGAKDALLKLKADGVEHAIAFSQYPQYSCTTTGSSLNEIWRNLKTLELQNEFKWSLIDRWPTNEFFVGAVTELIEEQLAKFDDPAKVLQ
ncbi:ferrochelatase hem15 [Bonamia ostreae]|uniref:Ferrochelatase hem15 n=1 Tax=Bonamia ostreae TaxID=126728 RepID=A0ABV2AHU8_9EUKA